MASPYERSQTSEPKTGLLRRRGSITIEGIENLLAGAGSVRDVTPAMILRLCEERKIDLANRLTRGRQQLYRRFLTHCFVDKMLSEEEQADLAHLRSLLHLSTADLTAIHDDVAVEVYGEAVQDVLEDFELDDDEAEFLRRLREELGLSEQKAERIYQDGSNEARGRAKTQAESRDRQFAEHRTPAGDFTGRSEGTLEHAIQDGLAKATMAIPSLHWFEVSEIAGYVAKGKPDSWHVTLRAGIRNEE